MAELPKPKKISSRRVIERMTQNAYKQGGNELAREVRRRAVALAEKIISDQQAEITQMRQHFES